LTASNNDDRPDAGSSPPCSLHEVDPSYSGLPSAEAALDWPGVRRWRKAERERLIAERQGLPVEVRHAQDARIIADLETLIGDATGRVVSAYWPFRGEPDLRPLLATIRAGGGRSALPVVVEKGQPLVFRVWAPGDALERGIWNIPVPAAGPAITPDVVIAPVVGFDPDCFRLGYGGGYFDRTLAALPSRPMVIGVGHSTARLATIHPQPHDIPMQAIITELGIVEPRRGP
jgi:5,10-methenyltetrahydrofolate synthetase